MGSGGAAGGARRLPVHPRRLPVDVHRPAVDDAPVRRVRHRHGVQRALPPAGRGRHRRPVGRLRPADPDGLRLRRPGGARRGRQGRRGDRLDRGHAHAVRRHPARRGLHLDDDQRPGRAAAAALPAGRRGAGGRPVEADRHDPERRAQGVHRPRHLHLPAEGVAAADQRHLRLLPQGDPALEHDLHLRLPHGRGRGHAGAGGGVHPRQRPRVRPRRAGCRAGRRRLRAAAVVLLRGPHDAARGGREVPRGPADLGPGDAGRVRRAGPALDDAALPHPDRRACSSPRSSPRSTWCASPCRRWPRCSAAPSRCTPTPTTRRSRCRPRRPPGWPCAPSRSSPTSPTSPRPSTRSPGRTPWRR